MTKEQILKALKTYHKGSFIKIQWETDITSASAKKQGYSVIKACESIVRLGVDYRHTRPAMQKQNTTHQESWFKHCEDSILMVNKKDCEKLYLQCFSLKQGLTKIKYKVNGKEVSKEQVLEFAIPSKMQPTNQDNKTFILSISNIKSLG